MMEIQSLSRQLHWKKTTFNSFVFKFFLLSSQFYHLVSPSLGYASFIVITPKKTSKPKGKKIMNLLPFFQRFQWASFSQKVNPCPWPMNHFLFPSSNQRLLSIHEPMTIGGNWSSSNQIKMKIPYAMELLASSPTFKSSLLSTLNLDRHP